MAESTTIDNMNSTAVIEQQNGIFIKCAQTDI